MKNQILAIELIKMQQQDSAIRGELIAKGELFDSKHQYHPIMKKVHHKNNQRFKEIINQYGWPGYSLVGEEGCHAAWLIIQHAILDPELQQQGLKLLKQAVTEKEADIKMVAFLEDRLLMAEGKPQIYGTQHIVDKTTDKLVPYKITDVANIHKRRAKIGFEPLRLKTEALNKERDNNHPIYNANNIPLFEMIYGRHFISLGGFAAIENMFSDIHINGLKALDIGFGLGGVAFYLADHYQMEVSGVEIPVWMVDYANQNKPVKLKDKLKFKTYTATGTIPFADKSFDLVYSKGVLNHVKNKLLLFKQIYNVLKPNGIVVIADWVFKNQPATTIPDLVYETKETYQQILQDAGFNNINFRNDSLQFESYVKELLKRIQRLYQNFVKQYSEELFAEIFQQHQIVLKEMEKKERIAVRIVANI